MICAIALGTLSGALLLAHCQEIPPIQITYIVIPLGFLSYKACIRKWPWPCINACLFLTGLAVGISWSTYHYGKILDWKLPNDLVKKEVNIKGEIIGELTLKNQQQLLTISLTQLNNTTLSKKSPKILVTSPDPYQRFDVGNMVEAQVKLRAIHGLQNPGSFDEEKFYFIKRIRARGTVKSIKVIANGKKPIIWRIRQYLNDKLKSQFPNEPFLPVISALTLGMKTDLDHATKVIFQKTGTSHLLAISGLHMGLVAAFCFLWVKWLVGFFPRILSRQPDIVIAAMVSLIVAFTYALLAGFALPTQRALIMISVVMLGICFRRKVASANAYFLAMFLVIVHDPLAVIQPGFWLSFLAVLALLVVSLNKTSSKISRWVTPQLAVFCVMVPAGISYFNTISLISPVANMVAIPVVTFVVVPFSLIGLLLGVLSDTLSHFCLSVAINTFEYLWQLITYLEKIPFSSISFAYRSEWYMLLGTLGAIAIILPRGLLNKSLGILLLVPLFISSKPIELGQVKVSILEVGQGLSVVLQTRSHTLLYDTGPRYGQHRNAGNQVIDPFLRKLGVRAIDLAIISHADADHSGGLQGLAAIPIQVLTTSEPEHFAAYTATACQSGQKWQWDGVEFEMLHPDQIYKRRNDLSCVLKVSTQSQSILLSGDITTLVENKLCSKHKAQLKSDILIVPHHGSNTSSSLAFIQAVNPQYAIHSVGYQNTYGHPHQKVVQRYASEGANNLLTCQTGAIFFHLGAKQQLTPPVLWRETAKRIWHHERS